MTTDTTLCDTGCGKPRDNGYLARDCERRLERQLAETPWLTDELHTVTARQTNYGDRNGGRSPEKPLPIDIHASEIQTKLNRALHDACLTIHRPGWRQPAPNPYNTSAWLLARVNDIANHPHAGHITTSIDNATRTARHAIDRPAERTYVGPCECGRDIYTKPGARNAACTACEATYDVNELQEWMRAQVAGKLVTAREGATLLSRFGLETKVDTIQKWHQRKRVTPHGVKGTAHLFLFDDLIALAAKAVKTHA